MAGGSTHTDICQLVREYSKFSEDSEAAINIARKVYEQTGYPLFGIEAMEEEEEEYDDTGLKLYSKYTSLDLGKTVRSSEKRDIPLDNFFSGSLSAAPPLMFNNMARNNKGWSLNLRSALGNESYATDKDIDNPPLQIDVPNNESHRSLEFFRSKSGRSDESTDSSSGYSDSEANALSSPSPSKRPSVATIMKSSTEEKRRIDDEEFTSNDLAEDYMGPVSVSDQKFRRIRPGTKLEDHYIWERGSDKISKEVPPPTKNQYAPLQEHLEMLIRRDPSNVYNICEKPDKVDLLLWQFEHIKRFVLELNFLVVSLRSVCTAESCPLMNATEKYTFRCAGPHGAFDCCAIDYMIHTLDNATLKLCSLNLFPERNIIRTQSLKECEALARRLYRIFPHCYYHHHEIFQMFENEHHLFERFMCFVKLYNFVPLQLLVPPISL